MHLLFRMCGAIAVLLPLAPAQTVFVPAGTATVEGNASNAYPWGRGLGGLQLQTIYDSSHFTSQGLGGPILITGLRWRLDATVARTSTGGSYPNVLVRMSTCPFDQALASSTFALNRGSDLQTVYSGTVTLLAGSSTPPGPGPNLAAFSLQTPFYYFPGSGDLNVEIELPATGFTGSTTHVDVKTTNALASRVYSTTLGAAVGTVNQGHGVVLELGYTQVSGLRASFLADVTSGVSPLAVQFTDQSWSSAPGGITSWAWDFDNDGTVDSTQRHPVHTFTNCGVYDVRLTVTDGVNPPHSLLRTAFVGTDVVEPSFTAALVGIGGLMQFTDTSMPAPTAWAWDFDNDGLVDSTLQNPQWSFGPACGTPHPVRLQAWRQCRGPFAVTQPVLVGNQLDTERTGATTLTGGCYMNLSVVNPQGVHVCEIEGKTTATPGVPVTFDVFLTRGIYGSATGSAALWRLVGSASTVGVSGSDELELATFSPPLYLPAGSYGMYVRVTGGSPIGSSQTAPQTFATPHLSLQTGASGTLGGTATNNRVWNGSLHYTTSQTTQEAGATFLGPGCAGTLGIPSLSATSLPRIGLPAVVTIDRLPQSAAFVLMGFGNAMSSLGPLPLDLGVFQATGCSLYIANDAALFLLGTGNSVQWNLPLPATISLVGVQYYLQALAPSPGTNALGGVMSDALASIVGI
jgi:hypothetical protein